jgi:hypothetical protein
MFLCIAEITFYISQPSLSRGVTHSTNNTIDTLLLNKTSYTFDVLYYPPQVTPSTSMLNRQLPVSCPCFVLKLYLPCSV